MKRQRPATPDHLRALGRSCAHNETMFSPLAAVAPDILLRLDRDCRLLQISNTIQISPGRLTAHLIGKPLRTSGLPMQLCELLESGITRVTSTLEQCEFEASCLCSSGEQVLIWRLIPETDASGNVASVLAIGRDTTLQRRIEQDYRTLFREMLDGFALHEIMCDPAGQPIDYRFLAVNPSFERLTGMKSSDLIGRTVMEVMPRTERHWIETYGRVALTGEATHFENYSAELDRHFQVRAFCPAPHQFACIILDITDRVRAEQALRTSEQLFATAFRISPDAISLNRLRDGSYVDVNDSFLELMEFERSEVVGRTSLTPNIWVDIGDRTRVVSTIQNLGQLKNEEVRFRTRSGREVFVLLSGRIIEVLGEPCMLFISRDITQRKEAEVHAAIVSEAEAALLRASTLDDVYRIAADSVRRVVGDCITLTTATDRDYRHFYLAYYSGLDVPFERIVALAGGNPQKMRYLVKDIDQLYLQPFRTGKLERISEGMYALAVRSIPRAACGLIERLLRIKAVYTVGFLHEHQHLGAVSILARGEVERFRSTIERIVSHATVVIHRMIAESALAAGKERLSVTLRSIGDGVITTDTQGKISSMNKVAESLTGWAQSEASGCPLEDVFHLISSSTREPLDNPVGEVLKTGNIVECVNHPFLVTRDGRELLVAHTGAPIRDPESRIIGVVLVFRDTTEKQRLLEISQRTDKLESLGVLAGGIAHDFNNLLGAIFGYIEMARESCVEGSKARTYLEKTQIAFARTKDLTQQLLTFSKGGAPVRAVGSIAQVVSECARFAMSGTAVRSHVDVGSDLWMCNFDKNQIGQVFDNIIINAQQAMPKGGILNISAINEHVESSDPTALPSGNYVKITFEDTGVGIPPKNISRVFDPFFTTKEKGTGLGLATVYSIVKRHGGEVVIKSVPNAGTTVIVYLPAIIVNGEREATSQHPTYRGAGRILLMDDEESIREVALEMLVSLGYEVVCAEDGTQALELHSRSIKERKPFTAVIMDLTIRGAMGGEEAVRILRASDKHIPVFVSSGYSESSIMANPRDYGFTDKIQKPFMVSELSDLLSRHLG